MEDLRLALGRMVCVGFEGTTVPQSLRELIDRGVSAVVLFSRNYESPAQLADLTAQIKSLADRPILICTDQEGGRVQRFREPFTILPSMRDVGRREPIERAAEAARQIGRAQARELRGVNIDMNLAPVLDVDSNPANPIIADRSFGDDPIRVARLGCALIEGLQSSPERVAACGKHFPGHGDTGADSHIELPRLSHKMERLQRIELPPFIAAMGAHVAAIMTSHILLEHIDSRFPATMSAIIIDGILRQDLGFDGVVISDDLEMNAIVKSYGIEHAVVRGAAAGVDLFMICHQPERQHGGIDALLHAINTGQVTRQRIVQANQRLDRLFARFVCPVNPSDQSPMVSARPAVGG